jgi:hypothetical protein
MALLRERRPHGQFFPQLEGGQQGIPRDQLVEAVTELIGYTERCAAASVKLAGLAPVPVTAAPVLEFGL